MQPETRYETAMAQMRANCARDLPWFVGSNVGMGAQFVIVAGGPSLRDNLRHIRARQKKGACVLACNGALKYLLANGIKPDIAAFLDISPEVIGFIPETDSGCLHMVASVVNPAVLDALEGRKIALWHVDYGPGRTQHQVAILNDFPEKPGSLIGGGNTIAMRAPYLAHLMGFRDIHGYGMDSSYAADGSDHAYTKHEGTEPDSVVVKFGDPEKFGAKEYRCSPWMVKQSDEFPFYYRQLAAAGTSLTIHGSGLIPDIWRAIRSERKMAA